MNNYVLKILKNCDWKNITEVNKYIANLDISNNSKRMVVYHFKKFCESKNVPVDGIIEYVQEFKTVKNDLSYDEVQKCKISLWSNEIYFIFNALLETGMRITEFLSVDWLNLDSCEIPIKTIKNENEYRFVFIANETFEVIQELKRHNYNFLNLDQQRVQYLLRKLGKIAQLDIALSPHVLRRTKGTLLRLNGAKIEDIADVLGHKSMETTRKYYSKLNRQYLKSISELSDISPVQALEINALKQEIERLNKYIKELEHELSKYQYVEI